jgi:hypothetical protein
MTGEGPGPARAAQGHERQGRSIAASRPALAKAAGLDPILTLTDPVFHGDYSVEKWPGVSG